MGRFRGDRVHKGRVVIGGGVDLWPVKEPPAYWRAMLADYGSLPIPGYSLLPEAVRSAVPNNIGAFQKYAMTYAVKTWHKLNPEAKAKATAEAAQTLQNLQKLRANLDAMRAMFAAVGAAYGPQPEGLWPKWAEDGQRAFNTLNVNYTRMAAAIYGNAFPVDEATGLPVLPGDVQHITTEGSPFAGFPVGPYRSSENDGLTVGMGMAFAASRRSGGTALGDGGLSTGAVIVIGVVALGVAGIVWAKNYGPASAGAVKISDNDLAMMKLACEADPANCGKALAALADAKARGKEADANKPSPVGEIMEQLIPVAVGLGLAAFLYNKIASGGSSLRAAA
jgi:hypothetical protein